MVKIAQTKVLGNMTATIPKTVALALDLKAGDYLEWHIEDDEIIVRKAKKENKNEERKA